VLLSGPVGNIHEFLLVPQPRSGTWLAA
jgi:hypothetical protein